MSAGVYDQSVQDLAHQRPVVHREIAEFFHVEHHRVGEHASIVPYRSRGGYRRNDSNGPRKLPYLGRGRPNRCHASITWKRDVTSAWAMNPGLAGVPKRRSKISTILAFSGSGAGDTRQSGSCENSRKPAMVGSRRTASITGSASGLWKTAARVGSNSP